MNKISKKVIENAKKGDKLSIEKIYEAYNKEIYYICLRMVKDSNIAQDIMQDTFLTVIKKLDTLESPEYFKKWLVTIAANNCKNYLRKNKPVLIENDEIENIENNDMDFSTIPVPEDYVMNQERILELREIIDTKLSDVQRMTILYFYYEELSIKQISDIMECSEGTVKSRLNISRNAIKNAIETNEKNGKAFKTIIVATCLAAMFQSEIQACELASSTSEIILNNILNQLGVVSKAKIGAGSAAKKGFSMIKIIGIIAGVLAVAGVVVTMAVSGVIGNFGENNKSKNKSKSSASTISIDARGYINYELAKLDGEYLESRSNEEYKYEVYADYIKITRYLGKEREVEIPSEIDNQTVKVVGKGAFSNKGLSKITIPKGILKIESESFSANSDLTEITLPDTLIYIGDVAFSSNTSLEKIDIPNSVIAIGYEAFEDTPWLEENKEEFVIVGDGVLIKYNGSKDEVIIPKSVEYISATFTESGIRKVLIPKGVVAIESFAFNKCDKLESVELADGLLAIGRGTFSDCEELKNMTLPDSLECIGDDAFADCNNWENPTIPKGIKYIGNYAYNHTHLKEVYIPKDIKRIGHIVFIGTDWWEEQEEKSLGTGAIIADDNVLLKCENSDEEELTVPEGITYISEVSRYSYTVKKITLPSTVRVIGDYALSDLYELVEINIPEGLERIDASAFSGCKSLEKIIIPGNVKRIERYAFSSCYCLDDIKICEGVESIGEGAFYGCGDAEVEVPASVKIIEEDAFRGIGKIYGKAGSYAEEYAKANYIKFEVR